MTDLVERLRFDVGSRPGGICEEAADEIERLRARVAELEAEVEQLGIMGDVCVYHALKRVCTNCRCKRAPPNGRGSQHE